MFDRRAFQSWSLVILGAVSFAALFVVIALMVELLTEGAMRVTDTVLAFGMMAFAGYVAVAAHHLRSAAQDSD